MKNLQEQWIRWEPPVIEATKKYSLVDYFDSSENGLVITLKCQKNTDKVLQIVFNYSIHTFRVSDKQIRNKKFNNLSAKYGEDFFDWTFFKVENSEYFKWLSDESYTVSEDVYTHFCIVLPEIIFDIASGYEPEFEFNSYIITNTKRFKNV